jgi:hypothetical protein
MMRAPSPAKPATGATRRERKIPPCPDDRPAGLAPPTTPALRFLWDDMATEDRNYSFLYQVTHITKDRGALTHDDAVAGAVAHFQRAMMMDVDQAAKAMRDEEMNAEIEDFLEGFNQPTYRGMRINGQRVATWSSQRGIC